MAASILSAAEAPGQASVELRGVSCGLPGRRLLDALSWRLPQGVICLLYGANGAGKSSLLKLLAGLLEGQPGLCIEGTGEVLGQPLLGRGGAQRARLGYMPQQGGLYEELSVAENLQFRAELLDLPDAATFLQTHVQAHGLQPVWRQKVIQLSGGWRQRVAFAAALLAGPRLLLLDEPSAGVDLEAKAQIWARIHGLREAGVTVLVSSHDSEDAQQCEQLLALASGRLVFQGRPQDLAAGLGDGSLQAGLRALLRVSTVPCP